MNVQARLTSLAQAIGADIKSLRASIASSLVWGGIGGVLANQTDLQEALEGKLSLSGGSLTGAINNTFPVTISSANALDLGSIDSDTIMVATGSQTQIRSLGDTAAGTRRRLIFIGNAGLSPSASLILPGSSLIAAKAGDVAEFESAGGNVWRCTAYLLADGSQVTIAAQLALQSNRISKLAMTGSPGESYTNGGTVTLYFAPINGAKRGQIRMKCVTAEHGFPVGSELLYPLTFGYVLGTTSYGISADVYTPGSGGLLILTIAAGGIPVISKATKAMATLTPASWRLIAEFSES